MPAPAAWSGPALLVPMGLEGLIVTESCYQTSSSGHDDWAWLAADFGQMQGYDPAVATSPTPNVFPGIPSPGAPAQNFHGVLVHWALPDGLTRGAQGPDGKVAYPAVPNRWLVVRKAISPKDATAWAYQAWVVASDYLNGTGSSFPTATGGTTLGKAWTLDTWPGEAALAGHTLSPPLTAVGSGDPTFAASVPNVQNVFTFADALDAMAPGPLSYTVYGWYGDPGLDPLQGAAFGPEGWQTADQWHQLMRQLGWNAGEPAASGTPREVYPARLLCHGLLYNVCWPGPYAPRISAVPPTDPHEAGWVRPQVAIAHNAMDALAALLAPTGDQPPYTAGDILQAFLADELAVLDRPGAAAQLALLRQDGWFKGHEGGTSWELVAPRQATAPGGDAAPPTLTPDQADALTALNTAQRLLDACDDALNGEQETLYGLWWKQAYLANWPALFPKDQKLKTQRLALVQPAFAAATQAVASTIARREALCRQRDAAYRDLLALLGDLAPVASPRPGFFQPTNPVIMVTGAGRAFRHGSDGRYSADDTLACRFAGQAITGVAIGTTTVTAGQVPVPAPSAAVPPEVAALAAEAFFLDPTNAPVIAAIANPQDPLALLDVVREEQTLVWNAAAYDLLDPQALAAHTTFVGAGGAPAVPSPVGVTPWSPPWSPLFLDWRGTYLPGTPTPAAALDAWVFPNADGSDATARFGYGWSPRAALATSGPTVSGRVLLTPQASDVFVARLEAQIAHLQDLAAADPGDPHLPEELAALQAALQYMQHADVLAQALGGFNDALLAQGQRTFSPTGDATVMPYLAPPTAPAFSPRTIPDPASSAFTPLRAGHFVLDQLRIVDAFGQVYDLLSAFGPNSAAFTPTRAPDLVTGGDANYQVLELKPRLTQPARLVLDWLDARDDARIVGVDATANPICGWLVVNHVDDSLLVYAADGTFEGELLDVSSLTGPGRSAHWLPPADRDPPPPGTPPAIANPHVAEVINGLIAAPDAQAALAQLIGLANTSAWAIDPTGGWADQELPLLVGRPLAVVRARASLELWGGPATSQAWDDTGKAVTNGFETVAFPVQLGSAELLDDGLVAFFRNDAYATCYSPYAAAGAAGAYALPSASAGALTLVPSGPGIAPAAGQAALLTLVMAPEAKVHALAGMLPPLDARLPVGVALPDLSKMEITFRSGPALADPAQAALDLPALQEGSWAWLQRQVPGARAQAGAVAKADQVARLPDRPAALREGWLRLLLAGGTQLTYALDQPSVACSTAAAPNTVLLRLTIYNGTQQPVPCTAIAVTLPLGGDATALTADAGAIAASVALPDKAMPPWQCTLAPDGELRLVPGGALPAGQTVTVVLANVQINAAPGTAQLAIAEETAAGTSSLTLPLVKTPPLAAPVRP